MNCIWGRRGMAVAAVLAGAAAPSHAQGDTRPTLAVMPFTNSAMGAQQQADMAPLSVGIQDLLIDQLQKNDAIRLIERGNVAALMKEQDLDATSRVDPNTAARLGRILGAQYMLMGGFVIDMNGKTTIAARAVNVETSVIQHTESVDGNKTDIMTLITQVAQKLNAGLKLPPISGAVRSASLDEAKKVPFAATMFYSRALAAQDAGHTDEAVQYLQKSLAAFPDFAPAQSELKKLRPPSGTR